MCAMPCPCHKSVSSDVIFDWDEIVLCVLSDTMSNLSAAFPPRQIAPLFCKRNSLDSVSQRLCYQSDQK
jgi:hypothetical protein